jgi:hypothetical protein
MLRKSAYYLAGLVVFEEALVLLWVSPLGALVATHFKKFKKNNKFDAIFSLAVDKCILFSHTIHSHTPTLLAFSFEKYLRKKLSHNYIMPPNAQKYPRSSTKHTYLARGSR